MKYFIVHVYVKGHHQSYLIIHTNMYQTVESPYVFSLKCDLQKNHIDSRNVCFSLFDRMQILVGVELQAFDRICTLTGINKFPENVDLGGFGTRAMIYMYMETILVPGQ